MAETDNFRIYSGGSVKQLKKLAQNLEDFDMLLRVITGLQAEPPPDKFSIYLVRRQADLVRYTTGSKSIAGYYAARPTGSAAFSLRSRKTSGDTSKIWALTSQQVLFHEYAHHFMLRYFPYAYPAWYVEGFAEYVSTAQFKDKETVLGDFSIGRAYPLLHEEWLPMETLLSPLRPQLSRDETYMFYSQSWLLTHYLLRNTDRMAALTDYLARYSTAETLAEDFKASFGMTPKQLKRKLVRYLKGRGEKMTLTTMSFGDKRKAADITLTKLPPSAEDVLIVAKKLEMGIDAQFHAAALDDVEEIKDEHADDLLAQRTWALAHISFGDRPAGKALLAQLATIYPKDVKTRFYLAMAHYLEAFANFDDGIVDYAKLKTAKTHFAKAYQLDKSFYPTLYYYFRSAVLPYTENDKRALEEAAYLAPQVDEIRFAQADLWAERSDAEFLAAAMRIFKSLASNPHGGELAHAAAQRYAAMARTEAP
ncbi:MAG: hypothetical protein AAF337_02725 [Pseudomonadota bacterium]